MKNPAVYGKKWMRVIFVFLLIMAEVQLNYAQSGSGSYGNVFVAEGAQMTIFGRHSFMNGRGGILPGIVETTRDSIRGYISFFGSAGWVGAADTSYVEGYVMTYMTTPFIFPIGNEGYYRPAAISGASSANPINAAYYWKNPDTASSAIGGPFPADRFSNNLNQVSNMEYWDINGNTAAAITLSWNINSNISSLTNNQLCLLTIAGWDPVSSRWVVIPSKYDAISRLDGITASVLDSGTITTLNSLVPDTYSVYTLASLNAIQITGKDSVCAGSIIQLSVNGQTPGTIPWISRNPLIASVADSTGKIQGNSAGTTTIIYTNANGCQDSVNVKVLPLPTASLNTSISEICQGQISSLNFTFTGTSPWTVTFVYGSSNKEVTNIFSTTPDQYPVSPQGTTTYTITTVSDGSGCTINY